MKRIILGAAMSVLLASCPPLLAADHSRSNDVKFIERTAQTAMAEAKLAEIAKDRSADPRIKDFAMQMTADQIKVRDRLHALAKEKGETLPLRLDRRHGDLVDRFAHLKNQGFDKAYVTQMIEEHQRLRDRLNKELTQGDEELRSWSREMLPTIDIHLKMAEELNQSLINRKVSTVSGDSTN